MSYDNDKIQNLSSLHIVHFNVNFVHFGIEILQLQGRKHLTTPWCTIVIQDHSISLLVAFSKPMYLLSFINVGKKNRPRTYLVSPFFLCSTKVNTSKINYMLSTTFCKEDGKNLRSCQYLSEIGII